jgi:hypothetical protein
MTTTGLLIIIVMILWSWDIDRQPRGPNDLSASAEKLLTVAFIGGCYLFGWL